MLRETSLRQERSLQDSVTPIPILTLSKNVFYVFEFFLLEQRLEGHALSHHSWRARQTSAAALLLCRNVPDGLLQEI